MTLFLRGVFAGGAEQEVPYALGAAESGGLHLHQLALRLPQEGAAGGPLRHHPHHLRPGAAGRLPPAGLHRCAFRLQVNLYNSTQVLSVLHHMRKSSARLTTSAFNRKDVYPESARIVREHKHLSKRQKHLQGLHFGIIISFPVLMSHGVRFSLNR